MPGPRERPREPRGAGHPQRGEERRKKGRQETDRRGGDERQDEPAQIEPDGIGLFLDALEGELEEGVVALFGPALQAASDEGQGKEQRQRERRQGRIDARSGSLSSQHRRRRHRASEERLVLGERSAEVHAAEEEKLERDPDGDAPERIAERPPEDRTEDERAAEHELERTLALDRGESRDERRHETRDEQVDKPARR